MGWEMIPAAIGGANALSSGIKGKGAAQRADQRQGQLDEINQGLMTTGQEQMDLMRNQGQQFLDGGGMAGDLMNQAQTGGANYTRQMNDIAAGLLGNTPKYDFQAGSDTMDQAMKGFDIYATGARNTAKEQAGMGLQSGGDALDAILASRGISRGSGVAASAMGDMANQNAQQMVGLERDLANQAQQVGLDATKFDINRVLQEQGMGSNFALSAANQKGQNLGKAGDVYGQAYSTPLAMQQQMYQQNQVNPYMQMMGMTNPMDLMGMAYSGMTGATGQAGANAAQGGAGMGAGLSTMTGQMWDFLSNKNGQTPTGGYQPGSQNG